MKKLYFLLTIGLLLPASGISAPMSHEAIRQSVLAFIQAQTAHLPGKADIKVGSPDSRLTLAQCDAIETYLPTGSPLFGNTSIGVRCKTGKGWSIFVPARIRIIAPVLIANRPLRQGETLKDGDFVAQESELNQTGYLTAPDQALGKTLKYSIAAGQALKTEMLRAPYLVRQGQSVQARMQGDGFRIEIEAIALNNGAVDETVQVRNSNGKILSGTVNADGSVSLAP